MKLIAVLGLLLAVAVVQFWLRQDSRPSPEFLAEQALAAPDDETRQQSAAKLADYGEEAKEQLRRVFQESTSDTVRMICIEGLGEAWDYESMDVILDAVADPSPEVRGQAALAVVQLTGRDRLFRANGPADERRMLLNYMRQDWETIRNSPHMDELVRRLKESHEKKSSG